MACSTRGAQFRVWQTDIVFSCQRFRAVCVNNMSLYYTDASFCQNQRDEWDESELASYVFCFYWNALDPVAVLACQGRGPLCGRHEEWRLQGIVGRLVIVLRMYS